MKHPKTVKEAIFKLIDMLTPEYKVKLRDLPEENLVVNTHHTLGQCIRNEFAMWGNNPKLLNDCLKLMKRKYPERYEELKEFYKVPRIKVMHADDASAVIIKEFWIKLNKQLNKKKLENK